MIENSYKPYLFLSCLECSLKKAQNIFNECGGEENFFNELSQETERIKKAFGVTYEKVIEKLKLFDFATLEKYFEKNKISFLTFNNPKYPECLRNLDQPPLVIYLKGDVSLLETNGISIVGTRSPSFYGKEITEKFSKTLAESGLTIVSGLAMGVDKIAHETCLKYGGKTIAVLGNGFMHMYPSMNINLSNEIAQNGLLVTENYPTFKATTYSFPARNRIIAALSRGVLITEAGKKSGALITKNFALELGKDVFCVPGNVTSEKSYGTNNLLKLGHASCVTSAEDVLQAYNIEKKKQQTKKIQLNFEEDCIVKLLKNGEKDFDYLQENSKMSVKNLNTCLTTLQIRGIIKKLPGNSYLMAFGG